VNTLNFCAFSICRAPQLGESIMVALPASKMGAVDIVGLPSESLLYKAPPSTAAKPSMIMALGLIYLVSDALCLLTALESGTVVAQVYGETSVWTTIYSSAAHSQPTLSLDIAPRAGCYFTSAADSSIAKHILPVDANPITTEAEVRKTGHAGQQSLAVRSDEHVLATAGWDGRVRVYTKSMREVAVLKWHKDGCYAVAFGEIATDSAEQAVESKEKSMLSTTGVTLSSERREKISKSTHWLAAGSKDGKVSLWDIF
jgi:ASTRA-associated protein 1